MSPVAQEQRAAAVRRRTERVSVLLDSAVRIPGTRWRFGLDALIGLVPGLGDVVGVVLSSWFLLEGARVGAPASMLWRMAGNIALDAVLGFVPVLGDVLDVAFKANRRNARLLAMHLDTIIGPPPSASRRGYGVVAVAVVVLLLALFGTWQLLLTLWPG